MPNDRTPLGDVIDKAGQAGRDGRISLGDLTNALGSRGHFAVIFIIAATAATPLSGIPGVSMVCGLMIAIIAAERLVGNDDIYLPSRLRSRSIDARKWQGYADRLRPLIDWIDRHTHQRLDAFFHRPWSYVPLVICMASGLVMPFLEFIPFSASIVAAGVALISLSFVTHDGLIAVLSVVPYVAISYLLFTFF